MRRVKKSKKAKRSLKYDPDKSGIAGKVFQLKTDLTHYCDCFVKGTKGVVICSFSDGTAKVCFECLHTDILPKSDLIISRFYKRFSRRPKRPAKPVFVEELVQGSKLIPKSTKLIPKKKTLLVPKCHT